MVSRANKWMTGALLALFVGGFAVSCDALNEATEIDVPIDITFWPESESLTIPHDQVDCVNMAEIKDYADNKDAIESAELLSATFMIDDLRFPSFDPATAVMTTLNFTLVFDEEYGDTKVYNIGTFTDIPFADVMGVEKDIPLNADANAAIQKILAGQEKFCVTASYGPLDSGAADAGYLLSKIVLTVKFKASVI